MFFAAISLLSILTILPYFYFAVFLFCGITEIWGCNVPLLGCLFGGFFRIWGRLDLAWAVGWLQMLWTGLISY